jgi:outer membrane protein assembly factor BamE
MRPTSSAPPRRSAATARCAALLIIACASLLGTGCVYRMAIQQGNFLDPEQVSQLETGMTRSQVMFLLGTPMVPTAFDNDRWDYYYYLKWSRVKAPETRRLTVYFEDEKVSRIDKTQMPDTPAVVNTTPPA